MGPGDEIPNRINSKRIEMNQVNPKSRGVPNGKDLNSTMVLVGLGIAAVGLIGRQVVKNSGTLKQAMKTMDALPQQAAFSKYYKGGFDAKMTKREAGLILGISPNSSKARVKEAHKRIMLLNHPDRGGSPYLAAKINEAKDLFDQTPNRP